jgi:hypothetical protein
MADIKERLQPLQDFCPSDGGVCPTHPQYLLWASASWNSLSESVAAPPLRPCCSLVQICVLKCREFPLQILERVLFYVVLEKLIQMGFALAKPGYICKGSSMRNNISFLAFWDFSNLCTACPTALSNSVITWPRHQIKLLIHYSFYGLNFKLLRVIQWNTCLSFDHAGRTILHRLHHRNTKYSQTDRPRISTFIAPWNVAAAIRADRRL